MEIPADALSQPGVMTLLKPVAVGSGANVELAPGAEVDKPQMQWPDRSGPFWSGKLTGESIQSLVTSPAREQIKQQVLDGTSVVWVLVETGDKERDEAAAKQLDKRLRYLEQVAELPVIDPTDPTSKLGPGPALKVKFSTLHVRHDDPAEQDFLKMLAGPKAESAMTSDAWLAAVFGRGRVLGAWPARGFGEEQIDEVCLFLLGACSCQVKNLNPGWDLLMTAKWDEELFAVAERRQLAAEKASDDEITAAAAPAGNEPPNAAEPVTVVTQPGESAAPASLMAAAPAAEGSPDWMVLAGAALALVGVGLALLMRQKGSQA